MFIKRHHTTLTVFFISVLLQLGNGFSVKAQSFTDQINIQHQYTVEYRRKIQDYGAQLAGMETNIKNLKEEYDDIRRQMALLESTKDIVLREMKLGYYCDQCWRSKTEIEAGGVNFLTHLANVHGQMVPAPPDKYLEKNQEFVDKIIELKKRLEKVVARLNEAKLNEADYLSEIRRYAALWEGSITNEDALKVREWERRIRDFEKKGSQYYDSVFKYRNLYNSEDMKLKKDVFLVAEYKRLLNDYNIEWEFAKQELEQAKNQNEIEKNQWIELVINERSAIQQIFRDANVMLPSIMFATLAGAYDYENKYQFYTKYPKYYEAPANPSNNTDAKSFLDNLGSPTKHN